jgi:hypothetical protein
MRLTKKRGVIALLGAVAVAAAVAIPTVLASSSASGGPVSTATRPVVGPATTTTGSCGHSRTAIATDDYGLQSTASTSFVPVTGMSVDFTTAGHCAEITFSNEAAVNPDSDDLMYVRVVVDGTVCLPGDVQWMSDHPDLNYLVATSYTFVCQFGNGNHGHHNASVQYMSYAGSGAYSVRPTMVVRYG